MAEDEKMNKRKSYLQAYISSKEVSHKRAFTPPPNIQSVELPTLTVKSKGPGAVPRNKPRERLPIREMAMKRSRPSYLRDDVEVPSDERRHHAESERSGKERLSPFLYRKRSGFKLVKDGIDRRGSTPSPSTRPKKRVSLYDLYATHGPEEGHEEPHDEEHEGQSPEEEDTGEPSYTRREVQDILFSPKRSVKARHRDGPILKEGPGPGHVKEEDVMGAGSMVEPEHGRSTLEESQPSLEHDETHGQAPQPASLADKTAGGEVCPSCGTPFGRYNKLIVCTGCGENRCHACNAYDKEHSHTNVFYDYKFDFPLCIQCYDKAFSVQKLLGKSQMCYGNGNLTYALYYAQNAARMNPKGRYAEAVENILTKIEEAKSRRSDNEQAWKTHSTSFSRSKFHDPAWGK